jgi:hypothetical protein
MPDHIGKGLAWFLEAALVALARGIPRPFQGPFQGPFQCIPAPFQPHSRGIPEFQGHVKAIPVLGSTQSTTLYLNFSVVLGKLELLGSTSSLR